LLPYYKKPRIQHTSRKKEKLFREEIMAKHTSQGQQQWVRLSSSLKYEDPNGRYKIFIRFTLPLQRRKSKVTHIAVYDYENNRKYMIGAEYRTSTGLRTPYAPSRNKAITLAGVTDAYILYKNSRPSTLEEIKRAGAFFNEALKDRPIGPRELDFISQAVELFTEVKRCYSQKT
jgi:hypothetical protein